MAGIGRQAAGRQGAGRATGGGRAVVGGARTAASGGGRQVVVFIERHHKLRLLRLKLARMFEWDEPRIVLVHYAGSAVRAALSRAKT